MTQSYTLADSRLAALLVIFEGIDEESDLDRYTKKQHRNFVAQREFRVGKVKVQIDQLFASTLTEVMGVFACEYINTRMPYWATIPHSTMSAVESKAYTLAHAWVTEHCRTGGNKVLESLNDKGKQAIVSNAVGLYLYCGSRDLEQISGYYNPTSCSNYATAVNGTGLVGTFKTIMGKNVAKRKSHFD
jgi:hypothetical protein